MSYPPQKSHFLQKSVLTSVHLEYLLTLPNDYDEQPARRWPLLLTLHGSIGPEAKLVDIAIDHDIARIKNLQSDFPFVILSPFCPSGRHWDPLPVLALLDEIEEQYRIDTERIYVTGFSNGGNGTWRLAYAAPERFAALAPLAGWGIPFEARSIAHIPVWIFHGEHDDAVPVAEAKAMAEALRHHNGDVTLTVYPDLKHVILPEVYANPELYSWFLKQIRKPRGFQRIS